MRPLTAPPANLVGAPARRALTVTAIVCAAAAVVTMGTAAVIGEALPGVLLGAGLVLGAGNGLLAALFLRGPVPFMATSMMRLLLLTLLALASGAVLGWRNALMLALGIAVAQMVLAAASAREMLRRS